MTYTSAPVCPAPSPVRRPTDSAAAELAANRSFTAHVSGGLAGAARVVMMLHSRRYDVRSLNVEIREGSAETRVSGTVSLTEAETSLLLARLMRMPAVVSAETH